MKGSKQTASVIFLIIGAILFVLKWIKIAFSIGNTNVNLYPSAFFILTGAVLGIRNLLKHKAADKSAAFSLY